MLVIGLAVLVALAQLLLPLLARHPDWVAAQLGQRLHRPVSFDSLQGRWSGSGPLFLMRGVSVGAAPGESGKALQIPQAELKLDFGAWLLPSRHLLTLHVRGLELNLSHDAGGRWHVNGMGVAGSASQQHVSLEHVSLDLWLENLQVRVRDDVVGKRYALLAPQLRVSHHNGQLRFGGTLQRNGAAGRLHVVGRFHDDGSSGRLWLGADNVQLQPLLAGVDLGGYRVTQGHGQLSAWLNWRDGHLRHTLVRFDLAQLAMTAPGGAQASTSALRGIAGLSADGDGYQLRWAGDDGSTLLADIDHAGSAQASAAIAAHALRLAPLLPWLALKPQMKPALAGWLGSGHPQGQLDDLHLRWSKAEGISALAASFTDLGIKPVGKLPGIDHLQGRLRGDAEGFSLSLPTQTLTVRVPELFRQPLVLSNIAGTFAAWQQQGDWHLGVDTLAFAGAGYTGRVRGQVSLPSAGGAPFVDLYTSIDHADVGAAKLFWPLGSMSPGTIHWLDRVLVAGAIDNAQVVLRGNLADWPFRHNEGRFEAQAQLSGLDINYGADWPHAQEVKATARFSDNGVLVEVQAGHARGVKLNKTIALIPDFADNLLDLNASGEGSGAGLLDFVNHSPIGVGQADTLAKLSLGGKVRFQFHLMLPLGHVEDARLDGTAQLQAADLKAPDFKLQLAQLDGPLQFNLHGLSAGPLDTIFHGQPASFSMAIAGANSDPDATFSAQLTGNYSLAELVQDYPSLQWLGAASSGRSPFTIGFAIGHTPTSNQPLQTLSVDSTLTGIALNLPMPLNKPAATQLPLHLALNLPLNNSDLRVSLGDILRARLRLPGDASTSLAATLALGNQIPETLPDKGLRIVGHTPSLDVTGWVQHVVAGAGGDGPGLESVDVDVDKAIFFDSSLGAMSLRATPTTDALTVKVSGAALRGTFSIPTANLGKRGLTARLDRLYWPRSESEDKHSASPADAARHGASAAAAKPPPAVGNPADTGINPASLPPLHLLVKDLRLGDAKLGEARLETWPTAKGLHIEQLRALSSSVQINANGDWTGTATDSRSHMRIGFAAEDLGAMLGAFGYKGLVNGGKTHDQLDASWPGAPSSLSLASMQGTLDVHVEDGRIPDAAPGVGRLLGLVSLAELPRRLTLDFGDVFGKGLGFDSINGQFRLANGSATTDDLAIKGSAADIHISGRTGLRARDFDQQVLVVPHVGNSLPVVGAVVGGPIGVAAGLAVQGILGKGLNKTASARYSVTGPWSKPVMTLIEKHGLFKHPAASGKPAASSPAAGLTPEPTEGVTAPLPAGSVASPADSAAPASSSSS